jgi:hypothetical protein
MRRMWHVQPSDATRVREWAEHFLIWVALAVVLAVILGTSLQTWAHSDLSSIPTPAEATQHEDQTPQPQLPAVQPTSASMPEAPLSIPLFVLMAVALAHGLWRWRRTTACGLVLVLTAFTFGIAVHAVHHLSEPEKAAECLVFSASQYASGTLDAPCDLYAPRLAVTTASTNNPDVPAFILRCRCDLPRAPPSFLS